MAAGETFVLQGGTGRRLIEMCAPHGACALAPDEGLREYFDTFDWRLFHKGLMLVRRGRWVSLRHIDDERNVVQLKSRRSLQGVHWWDLPPGPLRDALKGALSVRALLPKARVDQRSQVFDIRNGDQKTVLRATLVRVDAAPGDPVQLIQLTGIRGYHDQYTAFRNRLTASAPVTPAASPYETALHSAGQRPGDYSSKLDLQLELQATGAQAAQAILRHLSATLRANEPGLRADWDTEFLHDYRVAVRRTRSALTQIKGVFEPQRRASFADAFRDLGRATGPLRDLDVYLLAQDEYRALLPRVLQPGASPLFDHLKIRRRRALRDMIEILDSEKYEALKRDWAAFVDDGIGSDMGPDAALPAIDLARRHIFKRYQRMIKRGRSIGTAAPDAELHRLRIDCKKLRYLLEFFGSLFARDTIDTLVRHLKKLQSNLGAINDLSVQQAELLRFVDEVLTRSRRPNRQLAVAATGGLIARLHERQQTVRGEFHELFARFAGPEQARLYRELFQGRQM